MIRPKSINDDGSVNYEDSDAIPPAVPEVQPLPPPPLPAPFTYDQNEVPSLPPQLDVPASGQEDTEGQQQQEAMEPGGAPFASLPFGEPYYGGEGPGTFPTGLQQPHGSADQLAALNKDIADLSRQLDPSQVGSVAWRLKQAENQVQELWSQLGAPPANPVATPPAGGTNVKFGVATATWTTGNTVTVTPCTSFTDSTATGEQNVTVYIDSPSTAAPKKIQVSISDILAYEPDPFDPTIGYALPTLVKFDSVSVNTGSTNVPLTFGAVNVPMTWNTGTVFTTYTCTITCNGDGTITATMTGLGALTVLVPGVATSTPVYNSIATTAAAAVGSSTKVLAAPPGW